MLECFLELRQKSVFILCSSFSFFSSFYRELRILNISHDLDQDLCHDLERDLGHYPGHNPSLDLGLDCSHDLGRDLSYALDRDLNHDLGNDPSIRKISENWSSKKFKTRRNSPE